MRLNFNYCIFAYVELYMHNENILLKIRKWLFLQRLKGRQISYHLFFTCKLLHMAFKATCMVYYLVKKKPTLLIFLLKIWILSNIFKVSSSLQGNHCSLILALQIDFLSFLWYRRVHVFFNILEFGNHLGH